MYHGYRASKIFVLQIRIKTAKLPDQKHSLVYDCSRRKRYDVSIVVARLFEFAADDVKQAVKRRSSSDVVRSANYKLHNFRHTVARSFPQHLGTGRNLSPIQNLRSVFHGDCFQQFFCLVGF